MRNSYLSALEDEICREQLIYYPRQYVKLDLEFEQSETSPKRRERIKRKIESLQERRDH